MNDLQCSGNSDHSDENPRTQFTLCSSPQSNISPLQASPTITRYSVTKESAMNDFTLAKKQSPPNSPERLKKFAFDMRYWENVNKTPTETRIGFPFVVMNYNILAQILLIQHDYLYRYCKSETLEWNYRFNRIMNEITFMNPDIICLQEVQNLHLEDIRNELNLLGFKGIYKQKTRTRVDGCAIFFKESMFNIIDHRSVEFFQPDVNLLDRDNIGLMVKLLPKSFPCTPFVVCTTHLLYNPNRTDVRFAQMQLFLAEIDDFSSLKDGSSSHIDHLPIIMTGDLNSLPKEPVTSLIANGFYVPHFYANLQHIAITNSCQHLDVHLQRSNKNLTGDVKSPALYHSEKSESPYVRKWTQKSYLKENKHLFNYQLVKHNLNFKSVYNHKKESGEVEATTYQNNWLTVDYIYFSPGVGGCLRAEQRFRLPTASECESMGALPNYQYGSDHLSLAAKFFLQDPLQSVACGNE